MQSVIERRLDQLSEPARDLVAVAAAIGRAFGVDVLPAACDVDERTLVALPGRVVAAADRPRPGRRHRGSAYDFSHDKIREVAYAGSVPARRRRCICGSPGLCRRTPSRLGHRRTSPRTTTVQAPASRPSRGTRAPRERPSSCTRTAPLSRHLDRALALLRSMPLGAPATARAGSAEHRGSRRSPPWRDTCHRRSPRTAARPRPARNPRCRARPAAAPIAGDTAR